LILSTEVGTPLGVGEEIMRFGIEVING